MKPVTEYEVEQSSDVAPVSLYTLINETEVISVCAVIEMQADGMPLSERLLFTRSHLDDCRTRVSVYSQDYYSDNWVWDVSIVTNQQLDNDAAMNLLSKQMFGDKVVDLLFQKLR
ncbi:hypothetical protein [Neptuniibacter sp. QD34_54]|uniref:hypothetical protein n=1 Tax=Neptuniibacter sp. QD34_54 TaxID=3398208 RepID=UPI0039F58AFC